MFHIAVLRHLAEGLGENTLQKNFRIRRLGNLLQFLILPQLFVQGMEEEIIKLCEAQYRRRMSREAR